MFSFPEIRIFKLVFFLLVTEEKQQHNLLLELREATDDLRLQNIIKLFSGKVLRRKSYTTGKIVWFSFKYSEVKWWQMYARE